MRWLKDFLLPFRDSCRDKSFISGIDQVEGLVSKILSIVMVVVILFAVGDLIIILGEQLFTSPKGFFLNILIALEILENITAYLRKHVIQVELVIVTSLIAVARKIIILDLEKATGLDIIGLAVAIFALSISYWIIRHTNARKPQ
jgi:uncharacterized membrane protein (DUF373 family)